MRASVLAGADSISDGGRSTIADNSLNRHFEAARSGYGSGPLADAAGEAGAVGRRDGSGRERQKLVKDAAELAGACRDGPT